MEMNMPQSKAPSTEPRLQRRVRSTRVAPAALLAAALLLSASSGRAEVSQVLDAVDAAGLDTSGAPAVLKMGFRDPLPRTDYERLAIGGASSLVACQRAADQGLYCIDGDVVRYWPSTTVTVPLPPPASGEVIPDLDLVNCRDPALGLDQNPRKPSPCTGITVDLNGAIWLAGRKANSHSLIKVKMRVGPSCEAGWTALAPLAQDPPNTIDTPAGSQQQVPPYCAREYASGRPALVDLTMIDGDVADHFTGPGALGLEARRSVVFFPDEVDAFDVPLPPREIAGGKTWGLSSKEELFGAGFLQIAPTDTVPTYQNFVLVTTTSGRVLATKADGSGTPFPVFQMPACTSSAAQSFGIRVSSQSERVYVSDRACQRVMALNWTDVGDGSFRLVSATENGGQAVTLSTGTVSPDGLSVAPGIGLDLKDCGGGQSCILVADGDDTNSYVAAELKDVVIDGLRSSAVVFQVKGIPDCRWWPKAASGQSPTPVQELCQTPGIVQCGPGELACAPGTSPDKQYLDIGPLLPSEVTSQFTSAMLPELLIPPPWRGQDLDPGPGYAPTIELFFFVTDPAGVQFRDTFVLNFDVADLTGGLNLGCGGSTITQPDLKWDAGVTGSEKVETVSGGLFGGIGILVTEGCFNPTTKGGSRLSYYAYTMEKVPDGDGVYANLVRSLFNDLRQAQQQTACASVDPATSPVPLPPLDASTCATLDSRWNNADQKLTSCIQGSTFPRQNEAVNNCQSFQSQLSQYRTTLSGATRYGPDLANRIGEVELRVDVLSYVFQQHFLNSIPPDGFRDPVCASATCTP
jgi:hypothetical protein